MNRLRYFNRSVRRWLQQAGWPGVAGLVLLLGGAVAYLALLAPARQQLIEVSQETISLRQRIQQAAKNGGIDQKDAAAQLAAFYHFFPAATASTGWLGKIYSAAEHQALSLDVGEYRLLPAQDGKLERYQITLPVKGSYVQIRKFIDEALNEVPVAALEDVSLKRENIGAVNMEARIKLTLFLGAN